MNINVDVWLRGTDFAKTETLKSITREPGEWIDDDVRNVLEGMLLVMHKLKHPDETTPAISLRGLSWIVNPFDDGGVVIAIEVGMGAAIAGPFQVKQSALEEMISRVLVQPPAAESGTVH